MIKRILKTIWKCFKGICGNIHDFFVDKEKKYCLIFKTKDGSCQFTAYFRTKEDVNFCYEILSPLKKDRGARIIASG